MNTRKFFVTTLAVAALAIAAGISYIGAFGERRTDTLMLTYELKGNQYDVSYNARDWDRSPGKWLNAIKYAEMQNDIAHASGGRASRVVAITHCAYKAPCVDWTPKWLRKA